MRVLDDLKAVDDSNDSNAGDFIRFRRNLQRDPNFLSTIENNNSSNSISSCCNHHNSNSNEDARSQPNQSNNNGRECR